MQLASFSRHLLFSSACIYAISLYAAEPAKRENKVTLDDSTQAITAKTAGPIKPVKKDKKTMESKKAIVAKIGIVDIRRIVTQDPEALKHASDEWRDLFEKLQVTLKPANKEMADLEAEYKKKATEIESLQKKNQAELESLQKSGLLSKEKIQEKAIAFEAKLREKYERELAPLEYKLRAQDQQLRNFTYEELTKAQGVLGPKIEKAIDEVSGLQGWDFVISREAVPSRKLDKRFDVTEDVLTIININYSEEKAKKAQEKVVKAAPAA